MSIKFDVKLNLDISHVNLREPIKLYGFRWYCPYHVGCGSENGKRFHRWIQELKHESASATFLFARLLSKIYNYLDDPPDLIIPFPSSKAKRNRLLPIVEKMCQMKQYSGVCWNESLIRRTSIGERSKNEDKHKETIKFYSHWRFIEATHILIVDDVTTSLSSLRAGSQILLENCNNSKIISCLAFAFSNSDWYKFARKGLVFQDDPFFPELPDTRQDNWINDWKYYLYNLYFDL